MSNIPDEVKTKIEEAATREEIYEPKYGGKDHSGYDTMMKYEINDERYDCFERGAHFGYSLVQQEIERLNKLLDEIAKGEKMLVNRTGVGEYTVVFKSGDDAAKYYKDGF